MSCHCKHHLILTATLWGLVLPSFTFPQWSEVEPKGKGAWLGFQSQYVVKPDSTSRFSRAPVSLPNFQQGNEAETHAGLRKDTLGPYGNGGRVPRQESLGLHLLAIHFNVCNVVLEDCRDVDLGELILAEDNEKAGLPTGPVAHNHQLLPDCSHGLNWQSRGRGFGRKKRTQ